jgi:dihydrolipoamide dehydrogenase
VDSFDVVVLGAGSGGERVARQLAHGGKRVAVVEAQRVGGECPYTACIPSKAMLRAAAARHDAGRLVALGAAATAVPLEDDDLAWQSAVRRRDEQAEHLDDSDAARDLEDDGVVLVRGRGQVTRPGVVAVAGRQLEYDDLVVATGSAPVRPDVPGLSEVGAWTSVEALTSPRRPRSLLVLGGGAIGCELSQIFARFGTEVVLVESSDQLLGGEEPRVAATMVDVLGEDGVDVRLATAVDRLEPGVRAHLDDGSRIDVEQVLVATGRRPSTQGLEPLGLTVADGGGIEVDEQCRAADHVYAVGDVTDLAPYTHMANYQADVVADVLLGGDRKVDRTAIPRCVYTDPPVASVGRFDGAVTGCVDLSELPRSNTDGASRGLLVLSSDGEVLVGAAAVGLHADELLAEATLAIRARVPLPVLVDVVRPFPTVGEAYLPAVQQLIASARS